MTKVRIHMFMITLSFINYLNFTDLENKWK